MTENPTKRVLEELYFEEELTLAEIGDRYGVVKQTVANWMEECGLDRRTGKPPLKQQPWHDADTLRELHHGEELTYAEMAERLGCGERTIWTWMDEHDIEGENRIDRAQAASRVNYAQYYTNNSGYARWRARSGYETDSVAVHRLVAVAEYGFDAVAGNVVHHKNGVKWDNRPQNLEPMTDAQHKRLHALNR